MIDEIIYFSTKPYLLLKEIIGGYVAYPLAEFAEKRSIRPKVKELKHYYSLSASVRNKMALDRLSEILEFSGQSVPYYKDLFHETGFNPLSVKKDIRYFSDLPFLTKEIIREQGERLLSTPLNRVLHHDRKTGGSTGVSCMIYYDQEGLDYSSAVVRYCRGMIGKLPHKTELHFAAQFVGDLPPKWPSREDFKCFAMNRSNIFFSRLDAVGLDLIEASLRKRRPFLVHSHPSTIYALACHLEKKGEIGKLFQIFESSGELLQDYQREKIEKILKCDIVDRYGLAEFGIIAYELDGPGKGLQILESEGWAESFKNSSSSSADEELVFTGFRNKLMPLIRYRTGDFAKVEKKEDGVYLTNVVGRIHDMVPIHGVLHPTHHIMDVLDHRVGGIQEFQIDMRTSPPTLRIIPEPFAKTEEIQAKIEKFWSDAFLITFVGHNDLVRVGRHAKFRHVVNP